LICSFNFLIFLAVCLNISTVINIKILTNYNQQTQSYKFTSHIAAFLSVVLITKMLEICKHTSYDQNVQLIFKSYLPVVYGTPLKEGLVYLINMNYIDAVKTLWGKDNGRRGIIKIFEVLQDTRLKKQMFYVSNLS
jgi:hypothetical protein